MSRNLVKRAIMQRYLTPPTTLDDHERAGDANRATPHSSSTKRWNANAISTAPLAADAKIESAGSVAKLTPKRAAGLTLECNDASVVSEDRTMHSTMWENGKRCDPKNYNAAAGRNSRAETGHPGFPASPPAIPMELRFLEQHPLGTAHNVPSWLADVREMRARTLYDDGRRPSFRKDDGSFIDSDSIDLVAYHAVARSQGRVVGCVRVARLTRIDSGVVSSSIGEERLANVLRDLGTKRERTCEASRWMVLPEFRGELGPRLVAASWAIARWLSMEVGLVIAGTRQKQDLALIRLGAQPVNCVPLEPCEHLDDDLRLLYFDVPRPPHFMRRRIDEAATALDLTPQFQPRSFARSSLRQENERCQ